MKNMFTEHPKSINETYLQHFLFAFIIGLKLIYWGIIAIIHGILPFTFKSYVSTKIKGLHKKINVRQHILFISLSKSFN